MIRLTRLLAMALKELKVVLLDKRARTVLVVAPVLQLVVFGLAVTLEVKNIDIGVVNRDSGLASERLMAALDGSRNVRAVLVYRDTAELHRAIAAREVIAGLVVPQDLSARIASGRTGQIGLVLDGRRINSAQIVAGYLGEMTRQVGAQLRPGQDAVMPELVENHWYNPNLDYRWFTMPALVALISALLVLAISLQSVARERELGTYDELKILPLHPAEVLIGKVIPAFLMGLVNSSLYILLIPLLYGVPLHGSLPLLFLSIFAFSLSLTGIGLAISTLSQTQQQAFLGGYMVMVPLIIISGFTSPVDNMPVWLQWAAQANPLYHMIIISQGVFLKDLPAAVIFDHVWPMLLVALVTLSTAYRLFRTRID